MEEKFRKKPCKECPFLKSSLPGYLGGFTLEETLQAANSEEDFLCHVSGRDTNKAQCAGRMLFASKTAKMFRDKTMEETRKEITSNNVDFRSEILGFDFRSHHKKEI